MGLLRVYIEELCRIGCLEKALEIVEQEEKVGPGQGGQSFILSIRPFIHLFIHPFCPLIDVDLIQTLS